MKKIIFLLTVLLLMSCNKEYTTLTKIPEASGICFHEKSNSLYIANDEGSIYNISLKGKLIKKEYIGNYDLEGISCLGDIFIVSEDKNKIIRIGDKSLKIKKEHKINGLKINKNHGIEGLIFFDDKVFVSTQGRKNNLVRLEYDDKKEEFNIMKKYTINYDDLSGLTYYDGYLYIISDKNDIILKYDYKKEKIIDKIKLSKGNQEGITFDSKGQMYVADDGGSIVKYGKK